MCVCTCAPSPGCGAGGRVTRGVGGRSRSRSADPRSGCTLAGWGGTHTRPRSATPAHTHTQHTHPHTPHPHTHTLTLYPHTHTHALPPCTPSHTLTLHAHTHTHTLHTHTHTHTLILPCSFSPFTDDITLRLHGWLWALSGQRESSHYRAVTSLSHNPSFHQVFLAKQKNTAMPLSLRSRTPTQAPATSLQHLAQTTNSSNTMLTLANEDAALRNSVAGLCVFLPESRRDCSSRMSKSWCHVYPVARAQTHQRTGGWHWPGGAGV